MPRRDETFASAAGHPLVGTLSLPDGEVEATAIFSHCFTCTRSSKAAVRIADELARCGIATLRFDFTGLGASGGDFAAAGFASDVDDLVAAAAHLGSALTPPSLLVGHSLGGAAALAAAARIPSLRAIATLGAPADVAHVLHRIDGDLDAIERDGSGPVTIGGRPFTIGARFVAGAREADLLGAVRALNLPLLIAHAPLDPTVGIENARTLFEAARHPKTFLSLDDANHLLIDEADARYAARMVATWASRYVAAAAAA